MCNCQMFEYSSCKIRNFKVYIICISKWEKVKFLRITEDLSLMDPLHFPPGQQLPFVHASNTERGGLSCAMLRGGSLRMGGSHLGSSRKTAPLAKESYERVHTF